MGGTGKRWKIATVRGIPLYVSTSWFVIAALYVWLRYTFYTTQASVEPSEALAISVLAAALFFGSVLLHESAHAVMARGLDLPVSGITLVFWGGATETKASARGPLGEFLVAFVGPATTLALAGVFWVGERLTNGLVAETMVLARLAQPDLRGVQRPAGLPARRGAHAARGRVGAHGDRRTAMRVAGVRRHRRRRRDRRRRGLARSAHGTTSARPSSSATSR